MNPNSQAVFDKELPPVLHMIEQTWMRTGELQPMAFIGNKAHVGILPMRFTTPETKDIYAEAIRALVKKTDADFVVFVAESWTLAIDGQSPGEAEKTYRDWQKSGKSLADHPRRREVVMVTYEDRYGATRLGMLTVRPDRTLAPIEWSEADTNAGRFSGFFKS